MKAGSIEVHVGILSHASIAKSLQNVRNRFRINLPRISRGYQLLTMRYLGSVYSRPLSDDVRLCTTLPLVLPNAVSLKTTRWIVYRQKKVGIPQLMARSYTPRRGRSGTSGTDNIVPLLNILQTQEPAKAILVFIHGFSDHCNAYGTFFPALTSKGVAVHSFDQRGWGRSVHKDTEKGLTGPTTTVLADITSFIKTLLPSPVPLFVMGHSMGGAEVLCYAAEGDKEVIKNVRGWLFEAPFISFHKDSKPNALTVVMGRLAGKILPNRQMVFKLDEKLLSRDPQVQKDFVADKLCHDTGTLEGLAGNLDRAQALESGKVRVPKDAGEGGKARIWLSHGDADGVCDYHGTEKVFGFMGDIDDKELKMYKGWYHKSKSGSLHRSLHPSNATLQCMQNRVLIRRRMLKM